MRLHLKKKVRKNKHNQTSLKVTISDHLSELRTRFLLILVCLSFFSVIAFIYSSYILRVLTLPLQDKLIITTPTGGFDFNIQLSILTGFLASLPFTIFQVLQYLKPALPHSFQKKIYYLAFSSVVLAAIGAFIAYFIFIPSALHFFHNFITPQVTSLIIANEYLHFISWYLLGFALFFQLPLIFVIINAFHRLAFRNLMKMQRFVILGSFIVAAFLTPTPDFLNQAAVAIPIILLYQLSAATVLIINNIHTLKSGSIFVTNRSN